MTRDIDDALARFAASATHPGLDGLEDRVLLAISAPPIRTIGAGATLTAGAFALIFGAFSNLVPAADAQAAPVVSPFGISNPLAPSTLLTEQR